MPDIEIIEQTISVENNRIGIELRSYLDQLGQFVIGYSRQSKRVVFLN